MDRTLFKTLGTERRSQRERLCPWPLAPVALALCALFAAGLLAYAHPMEAEVYDLSLAWEGEAVPAEWLI